LTSYKDKPAAIILAAIAATSFAIFLLAVLGHMLLVVFGGVLFAILLTNVATLIARRTGMAPGWSLAALLLFVVVAFGLVGYFLATAAVAQAQEFLADLPTYTNTLANFLKRQPGGDALVSEFSGIGTETLGKMASTSGMTLLYATIDLVIVLFIGIYLSIEPDLYTHGVVSLFAKQRRKRAREVLREAGTTLFWWLVGRMASMTVVGVLVGTGLWILGVPLALALGLWSGLITFLPNIGPILSTVPTAIVALEAGGPWLLLYAVLLHFVVQLFESYLITPMIQRSAIAMPPALTLTAQALIGTLFGIIGVALATPLVALSIVLIRQLYIGDYLGDTSAKHGIGAGEPQ